MRLYLRAVPIQPQVTYNLGDLSSLVIDLETSPGLYTLVIRDDDNYLYWLVVNIPDDSIEDGDALVDYAAPNPPPKRSAPLRSYFIEIYQQEGMVDWEPPRRNQFDMMLLDSSRLMERVTLLADPYRSNFQQEYTYFR